MQGPTLHNQTPSLHCAGALKGPECHQCAAGLSLAKARCGAGGHPGGRSSPLPGVLHFSKGQREAGGPRSVAPVKQNYNYIHPLPPGPRRAVKYSCFLPLRGEGLLGASPPRQTALQSASQPAPCLLLPSSGAGWEPQRSRAFGASLPYTRPSKPRSSTPVDVETPYHLISLPFPLIWGNALNSTIKLKVMCPDKSIKILFATPTDKSHPIQGLASCLNIWLILSRAHNNT